MALRWLAAIAREARTCISTGTFAVADDAMGDGPFEVTLRGASASLVGKHVFGGLREIWVRDVYLGGGYLSVPDGSVVVDLGANIGNFTLLALGHGPHVRAVCVEPNPELVPLLQQSLAINGWTDRAQIFPSFLIGPRNLVKVPPSMPPIDEDQLIARAGLDRIDFLKCDIEGGEFDLLHPGSSLLRMARQIAIEVHRAAGPADEFAGLLRAAGFEVRESFSGADAFILLARRTH